AGRGRAARHRGHPDRQRAQLADPVRRASAHLGSLRGNGGAPGTAAACLPSDHPRPPPDGPAGATCVTTATTRWRGHGGSSGRLGSMADTLPLMAVHAHPDDEASSTGGVLAKYSDEGIRTVVVTCTNGEFGDTPDGVKPGQDGHQEQAVAEIRL